MERGYWGGKGEERKENKEGKPGEYRDKDATER